MCALRDATSLGLNFKKKKKKYIRSCSSSLFSVRCCTQLTGTKATRYLTFSNGRVHVHKDRSCAGEGKVYSLAPVDGKVEVSTPEKDEEFCRLSIIESSSVIVVKFSYNKERSAGDWRELKSLLVSQNAELKSKLSLPNEEKEEAQ